MDMDLTRFNVPKLLHNAFDKDIPGNLWNDCIEVLDQGNGLFLHGSPGVGKSHLSVALLRWAFEKERRRKCATEKRRREDAHDQYERMKREGTLTRRVLRGDDPEEDMIEVVVPEPPRWTEQDDQRVQLSCAGHYWFQGVTSLIYDIRSTFNRPFNRKLPEWEEEARKSDIDIINRICGFKFLVLDDIAVSRASDFTTEVLDTIINLRYENQDDLRTIITSNLSLDQIGQKLDDRIASRIVGMTTVIEITGVDRRLSMGKAGMCR